MRKEHSSCGVRQTHDRRSQFSPDHLETYRCQWRVQTGFFVSGGYPTKPPALMRSSIGGPEVLCRPMATPARLSVCLIIWTWLLALLGSLSLLPATLNNLNHKLYPPWDFLKEYLDPPT